MKKSKILSLLLILTFCFSFTLQAYCSNEGQESEVYGKVVLVNSDNNYLNIESGGEKVAVLITTGTKIFYDGKELTIKDINNGDVLKIKGFYVDKSIIADEVQVIEKTAPKEEAVIYTIFHDAQGPLLPGETLKVTIFASPGGKAFFDIGDNISGIEMKEVATGRYEGEYIVSVGDKVKDIPVMGYIIMEDGSKVAEKTSATVSFEIPSVKFSKIMPEEGSTTDDVKSHIIIAIDSKEKAGIIPQTASLYINGKDVTKEASISDYVVSYLPPAPLPTGNVAVVFSGVDGGGRHIVKEWTFTVVEPEAVEEIEISSVIHSAEKPLEAGDKLVVTMTATGGCEASFDIGNFKKGLSMKENNPGVYVGEYTVAKDEVVENAIIICHLKSGAQKTTGTTGTGVSFNIVTEPVEPELTAPEITSPKNGDKSSLPVIVTGKTIPGYTVEITVTPKKMVDVGFFNVGEEAKTQTAVANTEGIFESSFSFTSKTEFTIKAVTISPGGERSTETVIKVVE